MQYISNYFLAHFTSAFDAGGLLVDYGTSRNHQIQVVNGAGTFFEQENPYPTEIWWTEWKGTRIPFFFGKPVKDLITKTKSGQVVIQADIFASAFYLLSGWQEFYSNVRDRFGRFPFCESMQCRHNFVTLPVVNYYFDILLDAVEMATGTRPARKLWPNSTFTSCLTHDIDRCESGWKIAGLAALKKGKFVEVFDLLRQKCLGNDSWFNIKKIAALEKKHLASGTYFFLPSRAKINGHPNADYDVRKPKYQKLMLELQRKGHEVAVHGSFRTGTNAQRLQQEIARLPAPVNGNRFHYLQYDPRKSAEVIQASGIKWDSTLGFAEHFGFRNSYCLPFRPWDFVNKRMHDFTELPLNLMDTTLRHPNYMMLEPKKILPAITPMLEEIIKFNGCFTLL